MRDPIKKTVKTRPVYSPCVGQDLAILLWQMSPCVELVHLSTGGRNSTHSIADGSRPGIAGQAWCSIESPGSSRNPVELADLSSLLTPASDKRNFISSRRGDSAPLPPSVSGPWRQLLSRRPQGRESEHPKLFRRRITRLGRSRSSASTHGHLTSATEHERALTRRELALRAVAADRATTELTGIPNDRRTSRGFLLRSARPPVQRDA